MHISIREKYGHEYKLLVQELKPVHIREQVQGLRQCAKTMTSTGTSYIYKDSYKDKLQKTMDNLPKEDLWWKLYSRRDNSLLKPEDFRLTVHWQAEVSCRQELR